MMISISQLYIYPVKSLAGIPVDTALITSRGLAYDRRFMLVDANNSFLTQREHPVMALLKTSIEANELVVWHKDRPANRLRFPLEPQASGLAATVKVWDDYCEGQFINTEADKWFSENLDFSCRLVYMPPSSERKVDPVYALNNEITSFSDGYPVLLIGQSSLDDLNSRLKNNVPMNRFRPNIVIAGGKPFEEDKLEEFSINGINFYGVKLCARCTVTTTDQETGITGKEPLKTLAKYRMKNNKVYFGQNVLSSGEGLIKLGDAIGVGRIKQGLE